MTLTANEAIQRLETVAHQSQAEDTASARLSSSKTRLVLSKDSRSVFFATLIMRLQFKADWTIETAKVNGRELKYNPDYVIGLTDPELVGVMAHEVLHCCNKHFARRGERKPEDWNIACDLAINPLLFEAGFTMPAGVLNPGLPPYENLESGLSAEEYYAALQKPDEDSEDQDSESDEPGEGNGADASQDPGQCGGVEDATAPGSDTSEPAAQKQIDAEWSANIAAAAQVAEQRGELPGGLARLCKAVLAPARDWKAELREFITRPAKANYNWKRPNRRHIYRGIYLPSMHSLEIGHVIAAIDTSGSIGEATLTRFASELNDIAQQGVSKLTIIYHDSDVCQVDEWTPEDGPLTLSPCGGGGTDHRPTFQWIEDNCDEAPAVLVCLTDLYSTFPDAAPAYPVLWASTATKPMHPFGERLDIPAE